jgi:hypothetical protein
MPQIQKGRFYGLFVIIVLPSGIHNINSLCIATTALTIQRQIIIQITQVLIRLSLSQCSNATQANNFFLTRHVLKCLPLFFAVLLNLFCIIHFFNSPIFLKVLCKTLFCSRQFLSLVKLFFVLRQKMSQKKFTFVHYKNIRTWTAKNQTHRSSQWTPTRKPKNQ